MSIAPSVPDESLIPTSSHRVDGSGQSGTAITTATTAASTVPPTTQPSTTQPPTTEPPRATAATTPPEPIVYTGSFRSPSGNIGCMLYEDLARCDIINFDYPPPDAGGCDGAWGDSLAVGPNAIADFVCHGDTAIDPAAVVLEYGHSLMAGSLTCSSERRGITCEDAVSGSGFTLSRERVDLY